MNQSIRYPRRVISPIHQDSFEQEAVVDFKTCFPQAAETNSLAACAPQKDTPRHRPFDFARGRLIGGGYTLGTSAFAILMLYVIHV